MKIKYWFEEKLRWSKYITYIDGWISRFSLFVPVIGYLIIFNDQITGALTFEVITDSSKLTWGLTGLQRLQLLYFGFIFLGLSNLFFKIRKPETFDIATNYMDYAKRHIESSDYTFFKDMYQKVIVNISDISSFKDLHDQYNTFKDDYYLDRTMTVGNQYVKNQKNWRDIINKNGDFLRALLVVVFTVDDKSRSFTLSICLFLSTLGYILLAIPSIDLFINVIFATLQLSKTS